MTERAPAKINLCLFLGPVRDGDGRHELVTVMQPLAFGDTVEAEPAARDEVICPGVAGPNLAETALALFRERIDAADGAGLRLTIDKRIPVAGGMAGGSADAGAALRLAAQAAGVGADDPRLLEIATELGADVPAQVEPARVLATGAGERLERIGAAPAFSVVVLASPAPLSTADVFAEADRLGLARDADDLAERLDAVRAGVGDGPFGLAPSLVVNDLEPAARSLQPAIDGALESLQAHGADHVLVSGSGPTVVGLFASRGAADFAAAALAARDPAPIVTEPLTA